MASLLQRRAKVRKRPVYFCRRCQRVDRAGGIHVGLIFCTLFHQGTSVEKSACERSEHGGISDVSSIFGIATAQCDMAFLSTAPLESLLETPLWAKPTPLDHAVRDSPFHCTMHQGKLLVTFQRGTEIAYEL